MTATPQRSADTSPTGFETPTAYFTLLNLDAGPKPGMVATGTASYSDIVFGLFRLLGYRFSPRIADVGGTGFWRADIPGRAAGDYGPLNAIARNKVNLERIITHWPTCYGWPAP